MSEEETKEKSKTLKINDYNGLEARLRAYISHADKTIREFENNRKFFLEINLAILTVFGAIYAILVTSSNSSKNNFIQWGILAYFVISLVNVVYNSLGHRTLKRIDFNKDKYWSTKWFYRGNVPENVKDLNSSELGKDYTTFEKTFNSNTLKQNLIKDDKKQLYLMYCYQSNYYKFAIRTRKLTLFGISILISFFIGQFFSFLGYIFACLIISLPIIISFLLIFLKKQIKKLKDKIIDP